MRSRRWSHKELEAAVESSSNIRQVITKLGLVPAGGNYVHISRIIREESFDISHFTGKGWRRGLKIPKAPIYALKDMLTINSNFGLRNLKKRLLLSGIKKARCEECGWAKVSPDGRVPIELDHKNGNRLDNRIGNLRILCPNCHSLKPTHRGRNKGVMSR